MNFLKQKLQQPGLFSSFSPTDQSARLHNTFNEVQTFKRQLLKSEAALRTYAKATEELLKTTDDSMAAFPRVWRKAGEEPNTAALPEADVNRAAPTSHKLGTYPSQPAITAMEAALQEEVYAPISRWHKQYQTTKARIASAEHSKNDYDGARKEVAAAREAQLKHVRKTDGKDDPQLDANEEAAKGVLSSKRQAYMAIEEEVYGELIQLAADAQANLGFIRRALRLQADALAAAEQQLASNEGKMPAIDTSTGGPLQLASDGSTPVGTPTTAKPTGYGQTFQYWDPEAQGSPTGAAEAEKTTSPAFASPLGESTKARTSAIEPVVRPSDVDATSAGVGNLHLQEGKPQATGRPANRLQDSANEFPVAPTHKAPSNTAAASNSAYLQPAT